MRKRFARIVVAFLVVALLLGMTFGAFAFAEDGAMGTPDVPETEVTEPVVPETPDTGETETPVVPETPVEPEAPEGGETEPPVVPEVPETAEPPKVTLLKTPNVTITNVLDTGKPKLSWKKVNGADQYVVYRALKADGVYKVVGKTKKLEMVHAKAVPGTKYFYKVQAQSLKKPEKNSAFSEPKARICDLQRPVCKVDLNKKGKPVVT
ncbi:MAG: hypothetical protein IKU44_01785, partial [Firmicutes bacterium]|nr:hypothetical protein [Bacillota bacterium]